MYKHVILLQPATQTGKFKQTVTLYILKMKNRIGIELEYAHDMIFAG